jgi:two-component system sensor histidine kinase DesK
MTQGPTQPATRWLPTASDSHRARLSRRWPLLAIVWLIFLAGFVVDMVDREPDRLRLTAFLLTLGCFVAIYLWLVVRGARYPAPTTTRPLDLGLVLALAALALVNLLAFDLTLPWIFLYVVIPAAIALPTRPAIVVLIGVTALLGFFFAIDANYGSIDAEWDQSTSRLIDIAAFTMLGLTMVLVSRLAATIQRLDTAQAEIARLAAVEAVAEERLRFARDLHDLLGHSLSLITLKTELAGRLLPLHPEQAATEIGDTERVARDALRQVREAVAGYRRPTLPAELDAAREILAAAGIAATIENTAGPLPGSVDAVLAWTVREGVTNVIRHSRARRCQIRLSRERGSVRAEITDDGIAAGGWPQATGSGLSGLTERVTSGGGTVDAGPHGDRGFRLRVTLPLGDEREMVAAPAERPATTG